MTRKPFPQELKNLRQWVTWRRVELDGKPKKVPFNPHTGKAADVSDPSTWSDFDTAKSAYMEYGHDGVGFVLTEEDEYTVIDLDDCRDPSSGELDERATEIAASFGTRIEVSPSRKGLHIFLKGKIPGPRRRTEGIEIYDSGRYITVTGNVIDGSTEDIRDCQEPLKALYEAFFGQESPPSSPISAPSPIAEEDDAILIRRACDRNKNFERLWNGDHGNYQSRSEADQALCNHLAFWTSNDSARIDRLFRASGLMREKWDQADYQQRTISLALNANGADETPTERQTDTTPTPHEIYYDTGSKFYWITNSRGQWIPINETALRRYLKADGYSSKVPEDETISPIDARFIEIQQEHDVSYAGPLAGHFQGCIQYGGRRVLITESPSLIEPHNSEWPTIHKLLTGLLVDDSNNQLAYFLGWLSTAVQALYSRRPRPGQILVIAGPANCGKSLVQNLITEVLGGRAAKPYRYMSGATQFNGELFGAEHLIIEDEFSSSDIRSRRHLGSKIKDFTVNEVQSHHAKNRQALSLKPFWRVSVTVNDEPENLLILPPLDESLKDKLILLKAHRRPMPMPTQSMEDRERFWAALMSELPAFIHDLLHYEIPEAIRSDRFGVSHFLHPNLVEGLEELSPENRLLRLIDGVLFEGQLPESWQGPADQLEQALRDSRVGAEINRILSFNTACSVFLGRLHKKYPDRVERHRTEKRRYWTINPPSAL